MKLGKLNHIAIAVPDVRAAGEPYRLMGAKVSEPMPLPEHGVITVFVELANTKLELLEPLGDKSPIANFLNKRPEGGIHHYCIEVADIEAAWKELAAAGKRRLGEIKIGAHNKPVLFLNPKDFNGVLLELEQA